MPRRYWLMKCEPAAYTIDDLARDGQTSWEGVRNYQARNYMSEQMQVVDVGFVERFPGTLPLDVLKSAKGLESMMVTQKGSRLSVQPATKTEYDIVTRLGRAAGSAR